MYEIYQRLLDEKGLKNSDVARGAGVSNMTLSDWKHGKTTPKTDTMQKIADFLEVTVDYLTTGFAPIEAAKIDIELSLMTDKLKEYALKLSLLPKEEQEFIFKIIDKSGV